MCRMLAGGGEIAGRCRGGETCGFRRQMTAAALFPLGCLTPERGYAWGDVGETDSVASVLRGELPKNDNRYWRLAVSERRAAPLASQQANTFSLSGGYIHVDFSTTSINGQPRLIYQDPVRNLSFAGSESQSRCAGYWQHCERHAGYNRGRRVDNLQRVYTECDRPWSGRIRSGNNRRRDDNS